MKYNYKNVPLNTPVNDFYADCRLRGFGVRAADGFQYPEYLYLHFKNGICDYRINRYGVPDRAYLEPNMKYVYIETGFGGRVQYKIINYSKKEMQMRLYSAIEQYKSNLKIIKKYKGYNKAILREYKKRNRKRHKNITKV